MGSILGQNRYLPRKEVFENKHRHRLFRLKKGFLNCRYRRKINEKLLNVIPGNCHWAIVLEMTYAAELSPQ